ncbi:MAG: hypothetical protein ACFCU3_09685 [Verrucomicrobiales bacterium]
MNKFFYSYDPFADVDGSLTFQGSSGETCLSLVPHWRSFWNLINQMGPLLVGLKYGPFLSIARADSCEFQPVPGSSEYVDLNSGWVIDPCHIASVVAVREAAPNCLLGLQFFDDAGVGLFKFILDQSAHLDNYAELLRLYSSATPLSEGITSAPAVRAVHPWRGRPEPLPSQEFIKSLRLAHHYKFALRFALRTPAMHRQLVVRPCHLRLDDEAITLSDCRGEVHLENPQFLPMQRLRPVNCLGAATSLLLVLDHQTTLEISYAGGASTLALWEGFHSLAS